MIRNLMDWGAVPAPEKKILSGKYVRLEPLDFSHETALYHQIGAKGKEERFRYLPIDPPADLAVMQAWIEQMRNHPDDFYFALVNQHTGKAEGFFALMRMDRANGTMEIGWVFFGPDMARTERATEALYLAASYVFALGFRRFEWKCDQLNAASQRAARRFGFTPEGIFRQHMVIKGKNRDTAWFSMLDKEWPDIKKEYERWLSPDNFTAEGQQKTKLCVQKESLNKK